MDDFSAKMNRTLATDVRSAQIDLKNDQVWEFDAATGEPPAIAIQTTYGLRCRGIKVFPRFTYQRTTLTDPRTFARPLHIEKRFTNYLLATCSPFSSLDVELEYWVPASQSLCGRMRVLNSGHGPITLNCEWAVLLQPQGRGEAMTSAEMGVNTVLSGSTEDLFPVFFLTGGPQPSTKAYPALLLEMTLTEGSERQISWSLATLDSSEASFTLARQNTALPWDAEIIKAEMEEKRSTFHFSSENSLLDDLLLETQVKARQCLVTGPAPARRMTLLSKRQPDSPLGTFSISPRTRQGNLPSTVYDLWQASRILLPSEPELFKDLILGFLDNQQPDGAIPWAINPSGSPSKALTPPLLAGIACDVYSYLQDFTWLSQVYPPLLGAFKHWFTEARENSGTGWPVWTHPLQTGLDQAPQYSIWQAADQGIELQFVDSPALGAMLYHECLALIQMGQWLEEKEDSDWLQAKAAEIKDHVSTSWSEAKGIYQYRDIQTGCTEPAADLYQTQGNGSHSPRLKCGGLRRLIVTCIKAEGFPGIIEVTLSGKNSAGEIEEAIHFNSGQFQDGIARATSQQLFTKLDKVIVSGLQKSDILKISLAGFADEDISLFLPLWAGIPTPEQAQTLVETNLLPQYLCKFGATCLPIDKSSEQAHSVLPLWNSLLVEGLLNYGMRELAAKVCRANLEGIALQWQANGQFNDSIHASDAQGVGDQDTLSGLPGLFTFLRVLGIERISQKEIIFGGLNKYFSAFTVQYGRASLQMDQESTGISTLNGSKTEFHETGMQKIVLP